jgi:hypothetical protein
MYIRNELTAPPRLLPLFVGAEPEGTVDVQLGRYYETFRVGWDRDLPVLVLTTETPLLLVEVRLEVELPAKPK